MRRGGAPCPPPFRPKLSPDPQFTISGRRPEVSSNARVEAWAFNEAAPLGGSAGIHDHAGPGGVEPCKTHRQFRMRACGLNPALGQRLIQPPFNPAPAAMKPGQSAICMAQAAQRGRNAFDRLGLRRGCAPPKIAQRGRGPGQQGKHLKQLFRVAGGNAALRASICRSHSLASARRAGSAICSNPFRPIQPEPDRPEPRTGATRRCGMLSSVWTETMFVAPTRGRNSLRLRLIHAPRSKKLTRG